jgi:hypothetical protein
MLKFIIVVTDEKIKAGDITRPTKVNQTFTVELEHQSWCTAQAVPR